MINEKEEFINEALEALDRVELKILESEEADQSKLREELMREFHSLKGTSSFFDLPKIQAISHVAEDLLVKLGELDRPIDQKSVDALLRALDLMRTTLINLEPDQPDDFDVYLDVLESLTDYDRFSHRASGRREDVPEIFQLIYLSATPDRRLDTHELVKILQIARRNNHAKGISGMLLYRDQHFMQVLEGKREDVEEIFSKIKADPRHSQIVILSRQLVSERSFPDWSMGFHMMRCMKKANIEGLSPAFLEDEWRAGGGSFAGMLLQCFRDNKEVM